MPITVTRKYDATVGHEISSGNTHEAVYIIRGTSDEFAARSALVAARPFWEEGQAALGYSIDNIGPSQYEAKVRYGIPTLQELEFAGELPGSEGGTSGGVFTLATFSSMGGTAHITQSLNTTIHPLTEANPPDFGGAIGVTETSVEGVDVPTPRVEFVLHRIKASVTPEYMKHISYSVGKTNIGTFLTFTRCELMFMGFDSTLSSDGAYAFAFKFAASPTRDVPVTINGETTYITKLGWEYLWFRYRKDVDADAKRVVHVPLAAYVERIAEEMDFNTLEVL